MVVMSAGRWIAPLAGVGLIAWAARSEEKMRQGWGQNRGRKKISPSRYHVRMSVMGDQQRYGLDYSGPEVILRTDDQQAAWDLADEVIAEDDTRTVEVFDTARKEVTFHHAPPRSYHRDPWARLGGHEARGRRAGPAGYEVDDFGSPIQWKAAWDDDFRAGFAAGKKAKKIVAASTAYRRGKISQRHGIEWKAGYDAATGVKRGAYATKTVRRAEALGLLKKGRSARGRKHNKRVSKCISGKVRGEGWDERRAVAACLNMDREERLRSDGTYRSAKSRRAIGRRQEHHEPYKGRDYDAHQSAMGAGREYSGLEEHLSASLLLKPAGAKKAKDGRILLWRGQGWFVWTDALTKSQAEAAAGTILRNLKSKRSLRAVDPYLHDLPLTVGYKRGWLTLRRSAVVTPRKKSASRSAWRPGTLSLTSPQGERLDKDGEIYGDSGFGMWKSGRLYWSVTHLPSGIALGTVRGKPAARKLVEELAQALPDAPSMTLADLSEHKDALWPIVQRYL